MSSSMGTLVLAITSRSPRHHGLRGQGDAAVFHGTCAGHTPRGAQGSLRVPGTQRTSQGEGGQTHLSSLSATQTERGAVKWSLTVCSCVVWCSSGRSWALQCQEQPCSLRQVPALFPSGIAAALGPGPPVEQRAGGRRAQQLPCSMPALLRDRGVVGTASKQQNTLNSHQPLHNRHAGCSISVASVTPSWEPAWEMGP